MIALYELGKVELDYSFDNLRLVVGAWVSIALVQLLGVFI